MNGIDTRVLKSLVEDSGITYRQNSVSWIFTCPRCSKRDKLYIRKRDGRFVCWKCATTDGYQGRPEYALRDLLGLSVRELQGRLYGDDIEVSEGSYVHALVLEDFFDEVDEVPVDLRPLQLMAMPLDFVSIAHEHAWRGREYLEDRGITVELASAYDIHYHPLERRVIFPIVVRGRCVGWQARTVEPTVWYDDAGIKRTRPKILTPRGVDRERVLMFQDRLQGSRHVVLGEGPVDALKCHMAGGNVATMGASVSDGQLDVVRDSDVQDVYLGLDPDAAAEITRLCRELADKRVYLIEVPKPFKDLGEMSLEAAYETFRSARRINAGRIFAVPLRDPFAIRA